MVYIECPTKDCGKRLYPEKSVWNKNKSVLMIVFFCGNCGLDIVIKYGSIYDEPIVIE